MQAREWSANVADAPRTPSRAPDEIEVALWQEAPNNGKTFDRAGETT